MHETLKSRRLFLQMLAAAGAGMLFPSDLTAQAQTGPSVKPRVITLHGYNGSPENGFIAAINKYLVSQDYRVESPQLPGSADPSREVWEEIIAGKIGNSPEPPIVIAYSLSVIAALGALSRDGVTAAKLITVSGRRIQPGLPSGFPSNLARFYGGGVDRGNIIKNTLQGRVVVHSKDDTVVTFENNAEQLAEQIQARKLFVEGYGHFTEPEQPQGFNGYARRMILM